MTPPEVFELTHSGVLQVLLEKDKKQLTGGSAFLVGDGLVTNSHVLREINFDTIVFRFNDTDIGAEIRLARADIESMIAYESRGNAHDVAYLLLDEPELKGRHRFQFTQSSVEVGQEIAFLGYPFQRRNLTYHLGHISSVYDKNDVKIIQIDGSVNGGNSGGPLINLDDGGVTGIVTRAEIGFIAGEFDNLIQAMRQNIQLLTQSKISANLGGIDIIQGLAASQTAMLRIAKSLRQSANVGIGFAFDANHIRDQIAAHHSNA